MPGRSPRRTLFVGGALLALAALGVGWVSAGGGSDRAAIGSLVELRKATAPPTAPPTSGGVHAVTPTPASPEMRTSASLGRVTGRLAARKRKRLVPDISEVVDRWLDAAYVGGDYPRATFKDSFPGFTRGATRSARTDKALLSNADIGPRITGVTVTRRTVRVDLLAVEGRARAATVRVRLGFTTSGVRREFRVTGRVFLSQHDGRWKIFGYDVAKGRS